jgi:E3 ubiquitin-protein ligase RGLG
VADGQVSKEKATRDAVIEASKLPLTIVIIGVGDGPWGPMYNFLRSLPPRPFDNCYFVDYNQVITYGKIASTTFALHALATIPDHFKISKELQMI